ncbi:MAG: hypothetical protein WBE37_17800 [Bryobacteraceae bacterium]
MTTCDECEIIGREIKESLAELKRHLDLTEQDRRLAVEALLGGTEADALRFEELVSGPLALEGAALSTRMNRAMGRKMWHETRSGHRIAWGPWGGLRL